MSGTDDALQALEDMAAVGAEVCEHAGHEWADAGGGLAICVVCQAEEWREVEHGDE